MEKQIRDAVAQKKITVVLLVGGFGESSYLFDLLNSGLSKAKVKMLQGNKP